MKVIGRISVLIGFSEITADRFWHPLIVDLGLCGAFDRPGHGLWHNKAMDCVIDKHDASSTQNKGS